MKTRPLLMTTGNVRKIRAGEKTQTRRVMVIEPETDAVGNILSLPPCPYGEPGDLLAIKETFYCFGYWCDLNLGLPGKAQWSWVDQTDAMHPVLFPSTLQGYTPPKVPRGLTGYHKRPSLYLPKEEWRTFLEITEIRAERLQDISPWDALYEGVSSSGDARDNFKKLWDSINGTPRANGDDISWNANPWVWALTFRLKP
jgi:hypothetical protein